MTPEEQGLWAWTRENTKECPTRCGGEMVKDQTVVYTSLPPKYKYVCNKCGYQEIAE